MLSFNPEKTLIKKKMENNNYDEKLEINANNSHLGEKILSILHDISRHRNWGWSILKLT